MSTTENEGSHHSSGEGKFTKNIPILKIALINSKMITEQSNVTNQALAYLQKKVGEEEEHHGLRCTYQVSHSCDAGNKLTIYNI